MILRGILFSLLLATGLTAQQTFPLDQYAILRERLRTKYLIPGDCHGCSLPASWYDSTKSHLVYEDETTRQLGWYLALLATEYKLYSQHQLETATTLKELYFALRAINRLDGLAEYLQCAPVSSLEWDQENKLYTRSGTCWSDTLGGNRNGYLIREDVPPGWHLNFEGDQPVRHGDGAGNWIVSDQFRKHPHPASQDQLYHLMFGLAFVCKLIPEDLHVYGMNLQQEARNIVRRFMQVFDEDFRIRNPVSGNTLDGDVGGNAKIYSFFMAVAADLLINQKTYPVQRSLQKQFDEQNPWFNNTAKNHKNLWNNFTGTMWTGVSFASPNQIMAILLLSISNAMNGFPENTSVILLSKKDSFFNPEYKFFQNAFVLLHNINYPIGYKKHEMETMLSAMDDLGPRRYSDPVSCKVSRNMIWNRDCIFVQPRIEPCTDRSFEGHFNGIDYMLFHNMYFLQYGNFPETGNPYPSDSAGLQIKVLPNPAGDAILISYQTQQDAFVDISIHDASGRIIYSKAGIYLNSGIGEYPISLGDQASGLYFLSVRSPNFRKNLRILIQ